MKKTFSMENLDCANCANKMETDIKKLPDVVDCRISFMTQRITIEAPDEAFDRVLEEAAQVCRRVDRDCTILYQKA